MTAVFRAVWPIVDDTVPYADLIREAFADLPRVVATAKAELTGDGRFSVALSSQVPGSGRVTESVLVFEAPASRMASRNYWRLAAAS